MQLEKKIESISWNAEVPLLDGKIEELFGVSHHKLAKAFQLKDRAEGQTAFVPELVKLDYLTPETVVERLASIGLRPAPLREYASLRRHIETLSIPLKYRSLVYVGEFVQEFPDQNWWKTFSFFQLGSEYRGLLDGICDCKKYFLTPERRDWDYNLDRYAVAVRQHPTQ